jgi:hypothetical protein
MATDTQSKIEFSLPPVKEIPKLPVSGILELGTTVLDQVDNFKMNVALIETIDNDGSKIYLPAFQEESFAGSTFAFPKAPSIVLNNDQKNRLIAANNQKLGPLIATHLALNTDLPISDFAHYSQKEEPGVVSFYGGSEVMKSKTMAIIHYVTGLPIFSFDNFSTIRLDSFQKIIDAQPKGMDLLTILDLIKKVDPSIPPDVKTLRETINNFIEFTRQNPDSIYLLDLPGINVNNRNFDSFDVAASWSLNSFELIRRSPDDPESSVVAEYLRDIGAVMGMGSVISAEARIAAFKDQINKLE